MTATLSPAEEAEITRFGMFDTEVFNDIADHWADAPKCVACDARATVRLVMLCCNRDQELACEKHRLVALTFAEDRLQCYGFRCAACMTLHRKPETVPDIIGEVTL